MLQTELRAQDVEEVQQLHCQNGAGVGPCVFGCGLVLLPSLTLFIGLHLDLRLLSMLCLERKKMLRRIQEIVGVSLCHEPEA